MDVVELFDTKTIHLQHFLKKLQEFFLGGGVSPPEIHLFCRAQGSPTEYSVCAFRGGVVYWLEPR